MYRSIGKSVWGATLMIKFCGSPVAVEGNIKHFRAHTLVGIMAHHRSVSVTITLIYSGSDALSSGAIGLIGM